MSAPVILSATPTDGATSVVLGQSIEILFDQAMSPSTISDATVALMGPGQTAMLDAENEILRNARAVSGREYVLGTFAFPAPATGDTWVQDQKVLFNPGRPLRPGVTYTVLLAGSDSLIASDTIASAAGEKMASNYQFSFTTGDLNLKAPPVKSPVAAMTPRLDPGLIRVVPRQLLNNDLAGDIEIHFPGLIDAASLDPAYASSGASPDANPFNDVVVSLDPLIGDPQIPVPAGLSYRVQIVGNKLVIQVGDWPTVDAAPVPTPDKSEASGDELSHPPSVFPSLYA